MDRKVGDKCRCGPLFMGIGVRSYRQEFRVVGLESMGTEERREKGHLLYAYMNES
jgi:hypothetical protein